jgi:hypothetical protein
MSNLSNLTKDVLLRRIRKYEKTHDKKSKLTLRNKKDELIKYIRKHIPQKKVRFNTKVEIREIEGRTDKEKNKRKQALRKINKGKKENRKLSKIQHKEIPSLAKYLDIKKYNLTHDLKKKELMKYIKGIDSEDKRKTIYKQKKYRNINFKYNIVKKNDYVILKIYEKQKKNKKKEDKKIVKKETIQKKFKIKNVEMGEYIAEYNAKVFLIKYLRKNISIK